MGDEDLLEEIMFCFMFFLFSGLREKQRFKDTFVGGFKENQGFERSLILWSMDVNGCQWFKGKSLPETMFF